jgi:choline kinase
VTENIIILAAGKPYQGDSPVLLAKVNGQSLFDWQINMLSSSDAPVQVIIGYNADRFESLSNRAFFHKNPIWERSGSGYSLFFGDLTGEQLLLSYADILYRPKILAQLRSSGTDVSIAYDTHWKLRYSGRTQRDLSRSEKVVVSNGTLLSAGESLPIEWATGEFIGLVRFQGRALERLRELQDQMDSNLESLSLSGLVEWLRLQGYSVSAIDVHGDWAELNEPQDIAHFILGTKAETLERLSGMVKKSTVQPQVSFAVAQWRQEPKALVRRIREEIGENNVVVRSSARSEDSFTSSNAGAYTSVLNVDPENGLKAAIETVVKSYQDCQPDDQVLVQPMVKNVRLSGVAFTRTLEHGAPFYVVNYDESGDTESITSGNAKKHKSLILRKDMTKYELPYPYLRPLVSAIQEVESVLNYDALDIEFAMDWEGRVYLLQARPIAATDNEKLLLEPSAVLAMQTAASRKWNILQAAAPHIKGNRALFGIMPDWNPAEIIGTNPGKLAVSLYDYLILDDVWATQRAEYGYKDVRPQPLLRQFAGKPYIDIRASFNSFIPSALSESLTEKLVNFYLSWLADNPHLHDKVEFYVVPTCYGPGFGRWEKRLKAQASLNDTELDELKRGLQTITQRATSRSEDDLAALVELEIRHRGVVENNALENPEKVRLLLDNCKRYGTLPFAHLARSAFVAITLLKEAVAEGWITSEARDGFLETVETVTHELNTDAWLVSQGEKTWDSFVGNYGHLRPGTYDITSPAYWEDPERFLRPIVKQAQPPLPKSVKLETWQKEKCEFFEQLRNIGIHGNDVELETFLVTAIDGREKAKFIFTKSLSAALNFLIDEGIRYGLDSVALSNLPVERILRDFNSDLPVETLAESLKRAANANRAEREVSHACQLPPLLCHEDDFVAFILTEEKPNYIGTTRITTSVVHLSGAGEPSQSVEGCIVLIPQADPGYDWLFGQKISGLITMYGGANSHMAIRSAEFGLPAAIGVGEKLYHSLSHAQTLELDPAGETIRVIH